MIDLSSAWPWRFGSEGRRNLYLAAAALFVAFVLDRPATVWMQSWPPAVLGALAEITRLGESDWILVPSGLALVIALAAAALARRKLLKTLWRQAAALLGFVFVGVGLPSLAATALKRAIGRGRPEHFEQCGYLSLKPNWLDWSFQSFPSGHATTAFALMSVVGFISPRWFYPGMALAFVVAVSRVALGVHHLSDVLGGAALGILGAYAVRHFFSQRRWAFEFTADARILERPVASLRRFLALRAVSAKVDSTSAVRKRDKTKT